MWAQQGSRNSKYGRFNRRGQAETAWVGGLVFEKLVYGSMERAAEIAKTIPLAKKVLGCKIGA